MGAGFGGTKPSTIADNAWGSVGFGALTEHPSCLVVFFSFSCVTF